MLIGGKEDDIHHTILILKCTMILKILFSHLHVFFFNILGASKVELICLFSAFLLVERLLVSL